MQGLRVLSWQQLKSSVMQGRGVEQLLDGLVPSPGDGSARHRI